MTDIYVGIALSVTVSAAICALALWVGRRISRTTGTLLVVLITGFLFFHATVLVDDLRVTRLLPFSNAIILGNLTPEAVAFFVGLGWRLVPGGKLRKGLILMPMVGVCLYKAYSPAFVETPVLGDRWDHGVCRQTSKESCSAAAAATLLAAHGIHVSEQEMASLCLTSHQGTTMLGLYRGLKIKTQNTPYDVEVFHGDVGLLRGFSGALAASVGLKKGQVADPRYHSEWGWPPGVKHTVILLDFANGEAEVADPAVGREHWSTRDLQTLWYGEGLRLVNRH